MSSLPQGWHGLVGTGQNTIPRKNVSSVPTLRKKWNSPQTVEVPKTVAPAFRKRCIPSLPNGFKSKIMPPSNTSANGPSAGNIKSRVSEHLMKPVPKTKELELEVTGLKKELMSLKAENSVLKARVRRLDDENNQKARHIEKLQQEKRSESANSQKNKESANALLLRQKCLRLESALKEKDLCVKKMVSEIKSVKVEELKDIVEKYHKQFGVTNGLGNEFFKSHKLLQPQQQQQQVCNGRLPQNKQGRMNIRDQPSKSEVQKLRDMVHKLEKVNHNFQTQIKDKDQEIRRLKLQVQRQNSKPLVSPSTSAMITPSTRLNQLPTKTNSSTIKKPQGSTSSLSKQPSTTHQTSQFKRPVVSSTMTAKSSIKSRQIKNTVPRNFTSEASATFVVSKVHAMPKQKSSVSKQAPKQRCNSSTDMELKVQSMRENIAAKKIQKGWRHHRKMLNAETAKEDEQMKAIKIISSELKKNKVRKDRLGFFMQGDNQTLLSPNSEEHIREEVASVLGSLWENQNIVKT